MTWKLYTESEKFTKYIKYGKNGRTKVSISIVNSEYNFTPRKGYEVVKNGRIVLKHTKTRNEALKFAKSYMRSH